MEAGDRKDVLGCLFDGVTMQQAVERCLSWCEGPRESHILVTVSVAILTFMWRDADLKRACDEADMVVADGVPVVWASRILGTPLPERVAGIDLMSSLLQKASERGLGMYFLGSKQHIVDKLVELCLSRYPGARICGWRNGYFAESDHDRIVREIRESQADILFVGMPAPFKEVWCHRHKSELSTPVILGVGGSFDVLGGFIPRAPAFMRRIGMEWFWRLICEPRKMWKRYLVTNTQFIAAVIAAVVRRYVLRMR